MSVNSADVIAEFQNILQQAKNDILGHQAAVKEQYGTSHNGKLFYDDPYTKSDSIGTDPYRDDLNSMLEISVVWDKILNKYFLGAREEARLMMITFMKDACCEWYNKMDEYKNTEGEVNGCELFKFFKINGGADFRNYQLKFK